MNAPATTPKPKRAKRTMPQQRPGESEQVVGTPPEFLIAVEHRFGPIAFDLAATPQNAVARSFFTEERNSLVQNWSRIHGNLWLNPPFENIDPWAEKCARERFAARWTLLLVPASIGANWWRDHVLNKGMVFGIPRLTFVGHTQTYPKDLACIAYGFGVSGNDWWDWREETAPR